MARLSDQQVKQRIEVREVTHVQASWSEQGQGETGLITLQLILDNGADEYILRPSPDDTEVLLRLFERSDHAHFDLERKVLMFGNLTIK